MKEKMPRDLNDMDSRIIERAIDKIIKMYLEQGGDPKKMECRNYIDFALTMQYYDMGRTLFSRFVSNYKYDPARKKQPVYYAR